MNAILERATQAGWSLSVRLSAGRYEGWAERRVPGSGRAKILRKCAGAGTPIRALRMAAEMAIAANE